MHFFLQYVGLKPVVCGAGGGAPAPVLCRMLSPLGKEVMVQSHATTAAMLIQAELLVLTLTWNDIFVCRGLLHVHF